MGCFRINHNGEAVSATALTINISSDLHIELSCFNSKLATSRRTYDNFNTRMDTNEKERHGYEP